MSVVAGVVLKVISVVLLAVAFHVVSVAVLVVLTIFKQLWYEKL